MWAIDPAMGDVLDFMWPSEYVGWGYGGQFKDNFAGIMSTSCVKQRSFMVQLTQLYVKIVNLTCSVNKPYNGF